MFVWPLLLNSLESIVISGFIKGQDRRAKRPIGYWAYYLGLVIAHKPESQTHPFSKMYVYMALCAKNVNWDSLVLGPSHE